MFYREIRSAEKLAGEIKCFSVLKQTNPGMLGQPEIILPDGSSEIVFNLADRFCRNYSDKHEIQPKSIFVGQMRQFVVIEPTSSINLFGVRFHPGGVYPKIMDSRAGLRDKIENLDTVLGKRGSRIENQIFDAPNNRSRMRIFERRMIDLIDNIWDVNLVIRSIRMINDIKGQIRVENLTQNFGINIKTLERRFKREIGLTPKVFRRVKRLREVLKLLNTGKKNIWADVASISGNVDQAHFVRDFKDFIGITRATHRNQQNSINDSFVNQLLNFYEKFMRRIAKISESVF